MRISRAALCAAFALALLSYFSLPLPAQVNATATFTGQVTDPSGAAIVGATVKITSQQTGLVITRQTSADGNYTVPLLKAGTYSIEVTAAGFAPNTRKNITLQIQQVGQEDFKLTVGGIDQQVTVEGGAPLLNTETTELGNVINRESTEQLPLNGRNFSQLGQQSIKDWYNLTCFVAPPIYTFGNTGRNVLIGPGLETWDLGTDKDFRITEKVGLQFRAEFFNALNHANFGLPNASIGSSPAGTITSVITSARQVQFALHLHF
jgi:hypothetical protein